ncbi:unnamed protein product [Candida verbasci]|uniref:Sporulation-specific protein 2 n=1 Tax=Candida verbasci TaxID=1227364 RepID=A0A9W4TYN4_9ASCO|nr:unnamed protein product [Candida verbasci]
MLKSIIHSETYLINSSNSINDTSNCARIPSLKNENNNRYSTLLGTSNSKRSNFLKVCSWPFQRIESLNELKREDDTEVRSTDLEEKAMTFSTSRRSNLFPLRNNPSLENIKKVSSRSSKKGSFEPSNRCVVITNITSSMGINSVIQQVCGGPLEKIVRHSNSLEIYFIFPEHAKQFYMYGKNSGLLIVNGLKLKVQWLLDDENNQIISPNLLSQILHNGCRRCLIISKVIPNKKIRTGDKMFYPEPEIHYSSYLNVSEIRSDFNKFGEIMDIGSVISRKLCFSVFYYDIKHAINAKNEFELIGSELNLKYKDWSIWYGKDITDRACFAL